MFSKNVTFDLKHLHLYCMHCQLHAAPPSTTNKYLLLKTTLVNSTLPKLLHFYNCFLKNNFSLFLFLSLPKFVYFYTSLFLRVSQLISISLCTYVFYFSIPYIYLYLSLFLILYTF